MPVLEASLFTYLSGELFDRVYPVLAPEGAKLPFVTYQRITTERTYAHEPFADTLPWVSTRVQFTVWATSMVEAATVGESLVAAVSGYEGDMDGTRLGSAFVVAELDDYRPEFKLYRRIVDVAFGYQEGGT